MKNPLTAVILIVVLSVVMFFVFFLLARAYLGASAPSRPGEPTDQTNIMWFALLVEFVVCFAIVKVMPLEKSWSFRTSIGVGCVGFLVFVWVIATQGLADYVNHPVSWGGFGLLGSSFGCGGSALFKRG